MGAYSLTPFTGDNLYESFPSGHSTAAGAFFGAFAMLMPRFRWVFLLLALVSGFRASSSAPIIRAMSPRIVSRDVDGNGLRLYLRAVADAV